MGLFYSRPGRGLSKEDVDKKGVARYFDILFRRFWGILGLNILYIVASLPAIFIAFFTSAYIVTWGAELIGMRFSEEIAMGLSLLSSIMALLMVLFCGSGPATAGLVTVLRKHVTDTHSWGWSDFVDGFKKNFRQSLIVYVINMLMTGVFAIGIFHYSYVMKGFLSGVLTIVVMITAVIFYMMQMYTYQLIVCVKLKIKDIYKNAILLVMGKLPWNILVAAVSVIILVFIFEVFLALSVAGILLIFALFYSFTIFTQIFMTNNIVEKYILEPSEKESSAEENSDEKEE